MPPAIFLMGPTASGKTDLAVALAERLPCDIISVDSAMVYRGMDIGTAKPGAELLSRAPHRLIDIRDPADPYSAALFREDALAEMEAITRKGRIPLLVGGTMLYFRALQHGLSKLPSADAEVRQRLTAEGETQGWGPLHARLAEIDPEAAARIHPHDPQRIQRALEVYELTGSTRTELYARTTAEPLTHRVIKLAVAPGDRRIQHEAIARRFHDMLQRGLFKEVEALRRRGDLTPEAPAMRAVGYRQVWDYLGGKMNCEEMTKRAIITTRQLAKRQLTWLRAEPDAVWFDSLDERVFEKLSNYCAEAIGNE